MEILIVDDSPAVRRCVVRMLERLGHEAQEADGAGALLRATSRRLPDLVICDVCLGDGDGIELCSRLRRAHPHFPLILMSGDPESVDRAEAAGFKRILLKPFAESELVKVLAESLPSAGESRS
ncbi:response regulator [Elusimicrobiota bacterium]